MSNCIQLKTKSVTYEGYLKPNIDYRDFYKELNNKLTQNIHSLVTALLGIPQHKSGGQWRYGKKLNLLIHIGEGERKGRFYDFETQESGDALELIKRCTNLTGKELVVWARNFIGEDNNSQLKEKSLWSPITPVPAELKNPDILDNPYLNFMLKDGAMEDTRYPYYDLSGKLLGYVVRILKTDGSKITPPLAYCQNQRGFSAWRWHSFFTDNRTPYGAEKLALYPEEDILIVEGEKTAEAAQKLFPEMVVLSWIGGVGSVHLTQWQCLPNRKIILWPDNDAVGMACMQKLLKVLHNVSVKQARIVNLPSNTPLAWDLADPLPQTWSSTTIHELIFSTLNSMEPTS